MLLSSNYFPCIEYMSAVAKAGQIVIDHHEHFIKQTYRSRCHIFGPNGLQALTVPVHRRGRMTMKDVVIDYSENWIKQHLKSLQTAYASSPFYGDYMPLFEQILIRKETYLIDLNQLILEKSCELTGIQLIISKTEDFILYTDNDPRINIHPKKTSNFKHPVYFQNFDEKHGHLPNLSILDLMFNEGPNAMTYL